MDRANEQHVVVSDDVLCMATEELMSVLVTHWPTRNLEEDYADFVMSNGWLSNLKTGIACGVGRHVVMAAGSTRTIFPACGPMFKRN